MIQLNNKHYQNEGDEWSLSEGGYAWTLAV